MSTQSAFHNYGIQQVTDDAIARYRAANQRKAAAMQEIQRQQQQAEAAAEQAYNGNPFLDPEGNFARYLATKGLTLDDVYGRTEDGKELFSPIRRERELVQPYLDQMWISQNLPNLAAQGMSSRDLQRAKQEYMKTGRAMAMADHSDRQADVSFVDKAGSWTNAAARGVTGLADSASGLIKTVAGNDNVVSEYIDKGVSFSRDALAEMNQAEQQELVEYANHLMSTGDVKNLAKLMVDFPSLFPDMTAEQLTPLGVFSKGVNLAGKGLQLVKGAKTVQAGAQAANAAQSTGRVANVLKANAKVSAYSGYQMSGGMAQELSQAGIDPNSTGGILAVAMAGLGGAAITAFTPATLEKHFLGNFLGRGLPEGTSKVLAKQTLEKLTSGGLLKSPVRYGTGLAKNALKGAAGEGTEEALHSGLEGIARQLVNEDGTFRNLATNPFTDEDMDIISRRTTTGGFLGAVIGGGTRAATNTVSRFGDHERSRLVDDNQRYWADAEQGKFTGPATRANGYDPATFDPNTLGKSERALYDYAKQRETEIEAKKQADEADKQLNETLENEYAGHGKTARIDYDNVAKAQALTAEIDNLIDDILATGATGLPANKNAARAILDAIQDPLAKSNKLAEWADLTTDTDLRTRAGAVATSTVDGYEFAPNGQYTNIGAVQDADLSMTTAIETALGGAVTDLATDMATVSGQNAEFAKFINQYQKAIKAGYTNTAKEIAEKFQKVVTKHVKNNPPPAQPKYSDTVKNSLRTNGQVVSTIAQALYGARWKNKGRNDYKNDPIAFIENLMDDVAITPTNVLTAAEVKEIHDQLSQLKAAWENDSDYSATLSQTTLDALTKVK